MVSAATVRRAFELGMAGNSIAKLTRSQRLIRITM